MIIMDECELIIFISTVACSLSKCCSTDDLNLLSTVFSQLGDSLATILAKRQLLENNAANNKINNMKDDSNIGTNMEDEED
ncbi:MAG: hypothetical protein EWM47_05435 [Anaerolineaceae bacterium]|nr:MAG: hypothetical protein EWM47_05435 [Anaerolineaceae bacterium]